MNFNIETVERLWPLLGIPLIGFFAWMGRRFVAAWDSKAEAYRYIDQKQEESSQKQSTEINKLRAELLSLHKEMNVVLDELRNVKAENEIIRRTFAAGMDIHPDQVTITRIQEMVQRNNRSLKEIRLLIQRAPALFWMKRWMPDGAPIMIICSDFYARTLLGKPASFYTGKKDEDVWSAPIAAEYAAGDRKVYELALVDPEAVMPMRERIASIYTGAAGWCIGHKFVLVINGVYYICGLGDFESDRASNVPEDTPSEVLTPSTLQAMNALAPKITPKDISPLQAAKNKTRNKQE